MGRWPTTVVRLQVRGWRPRRPAGAHQPPDPPARQLVPAHEQLGPEPAHPGVAVQVAVDLADRVGELGVGALTLAPPVGPPPVVAGSGHPELRAHERDRVLLVGGPARDRRVLHGCSFANQGATFFAKPRSIRRVAFSLRSRSSSSRSFSDRSLSGTRPASRAFFTHLPDVSSWTPILLATSTIGRPESRTRQTAWSLYLSDRRSKNSSGLRLFLEDQVRAQAGGRA
jgi:hypothetical protein